MIVVATHRARRRADACGMDDAIVWAWTEIGIELLVCDGVAIWTWGEASWIAEVGEA